MNMKKIIALFIGLFMVLTLGGCSSSSTNENPIDPNAHAEPEVKTLADDTSLRALVVNVPENFETVARFVESTADGKIIEKDLNYTMTDGPDIGYALMCDANLADSIGTSNLEAMEKLDVDGRTVYIYKDGSTYMALAECGNDIYAVNYALKDDNSDAFYDFVKTLKFDESAAGEVEVNDTDLYDIVYTLDSAYNVYGSSITYSEDNTGKPLEKTVMYKFGESDANMDFRLLIRVHKNKALEDLLSESRTYEEKTINGITYTVEVNEDGPAYNYYTQHNDDVYQIRNSGKSGFFTTRSDESFAALDSLLNSISFK